MARGGPLAAVIRTLSGHRPRTESDPSGHSEGNPFFAQFVDVTTGRLRSNLKDTGNMTDIIGYWLSGLIALGIILIGARFFLAPQAAAEAYGVSVSHDARWEAYLSAKAV